MDEPSNTPDRADGELIFTVTHPFHPLPGQQFPGLAQRFTWAEWRVFFRDPTTAHIRSLPSIWTDLAHPDPFVHQAAGRAILRLSDLQIVRRLLDDWQTAQQEASG